MQKVTERSIGMVDVPLLSQPNPAKKADRQSCHPVRIGRTGTPVFRGTQQDRYSIVQDPFTSYYDAAVVHDLVLLIEKLGFRPWLVPFTPNGKPKHIKGFLRKLR